MSDATILVSNLTGKETIMPSFTGNELKYLQVNSGGTGLQCGTPAGGASTREDLVAQWTQSITKTNIGTSFVDIYNQTNGDGKSIQIDTNGKTEVKLQVNWNKIGTGAQTVQVLEVGTANVLITLAVVSGRNVSALTTIPAFAVDSVKFYKLQGKSTTSTDDPIFESAAIYLK